MMSDFEVRRRTKDPLAALPLEIGSELANALRDALELDLPELFIDAASWAQTTLLYRNVPPPSFARAIDALQASLTKLVPISQVDAARKIIATARPALAQVNVADVPAIDTERPGGTMARKLLDHLLEGNEGLAAREALLGIASGMTALAVYEEVLTPALQETGRLWQRNEITVSQEHMVTAAVERMMSQLVDLSHARAHRDLSVAAAAIGSNQHHVGARMVADAFSLCGWQATYLGAMVPISDLLEYVDRASIDVLAISATLARDVAGVRSLIAEFEDRPVAPIVVVGGRAFGLHPSLWRKVGADGYARTPLTAVALANELVSHADS